MKVTFQIQTEAKKGKTVLEVAQESKVKVKAPCEKGKCGKCKVRIIGGELAPLTKEERKTLSKAEIKDGIRLACMAEVIEDVQIEVINKEKKK
jgi:ferredoxin